MGATWVTRSGRCAPCGSSSRSFNGRAVVGCSRVAVRAERKRDDRSGSGVEKILDRVVFSAAELLGMALSSREDTDEATAVSSETGDSETGISETGNSEARSETRSASTSDRVVADDVVTQRIINLFQSSYFFCGTGDDADWEVFAPDCVFADEFSSFVGTARFRRNVTNFGKALRYTPERVCRLTKLERGVDGRGRDTITASWIFRSRVILLRGLLAASGETTYVVEGQGGTTPRIVEHRERWNTSKVEVFKRLFGL